MSAGVRFVSWVRYASLGDGLVVRAAGQNVPVALSQLGPGDVIGIDPREIVVRVPAPHSVGFAPNLFPFVELRSPDLPWRLSPDTAPWLALVVQEAPGDDRLPVGPGGLPLIELAAVALPSANEVALWSHAQISGDSTEAVAPRLPSGLARVISPRRLAPRRRYVACLVPCRDAGRIAGLGENPVDPRAAALAWDGSAPVVLPVYDHWYFTTGEDGDFETLARRLRPHVLAPSDRPWTVDHVRAGAAAGKDPLFTALVPHGHIAAPVPEGTGPQLSAWLDEAAASTADAPRLGPPLYGGLPAAALRPEPGWLADANLDPRQRAAAAIGAEAVRRHQDDLVAEVWRQLGDLRRVNHERDLAHLAEAVVLRWKAKHVDPLTAEAITMFAAPSLTRVRPTPDTPLAREIAASALPAALLRPGFRRLAATHARSDSPSMQRVIAAAATRRVPLDAAPATPPNLTTAATLLALIGGAPVVPRGPILFPRSFRLPFLRPLPALLRVLQRQRLISDGAAVLRQRTLTGIDVVRPSPLPLANVADVLRQALATPRALERHRVRVDLGELMVNATATSPLAAEPSLDVPVVELVRSIDPRYLLASVTVPVDSVGILTPHAGFIEAVMLGANDELIRELRWRGAAVGPRATLLRRFFDVRGKAQLPPPELSPVAGWQVADRLGDHLTSRDHTVIVIRGELVRRLGGALIYAAPARRNGPRRAPSNVSADWLEPSFRGLITDDTLFVGFNRPAAELRGGGGEGWYVVIAERPAGLRFGLDEPAARERFGTWADVNWSDVAVHGGYVSAAAETPRPIDPRNWVWAQDSCHMAAITTQRPVRVAFHAADLLPESV